MTGVTFAQQFPDPRTAEAIAAQFDKDPDDIITAADRAAVELDLSSNTLTDLTGLGAFPKLERLACDNNDLTTLDLAGLTDLRELDCYYNNLTALNLASNPALRKLDCRYNALTSLDVTRSPALEYLNCSENNLTSLNLASNPALWLIDCCDNQLTTLGTTSNLKLRHLYCSYNQLAHLDVSHNPELMWLVCTHNPLAAWPTGAEGVGHVSLPAIKPPPAALASAVLAAARELHAALLPDHPAEPWPSDVPPPAGGPAAL